MKDWPFSAKPSKGEHVLGNLWADQLTQQAALDLQTVYRRGPHMRSLISIDFPTPEMEPESAHVVSAVSVP